MASETRNYNSTTEPRAEDTTSGMSELRLPPVLAGAPLQEYRDALAERTRWLRQMAPSGSLTEFAVNMLAELDAVLGRAAHAELWISVDQAAKLSGKGRSTITVLCRKCPKELGAKKMGKAWSIHFPTFSQYLNHHT